MCNSVINVNDSVMYLDTVSVKNDELRSITEDIFEYGLNMRAAAKKIAVKVAYIRDNADTLCSEFEGETPGERFATYGENVLGIKRAQLNAYARVGNQLLNEDGSSVLYLPAGYDDYTITQLQALLPLSVEKVQELAYDEIIKPDMTVKLIKEIVADNKPDAEQKKYEKEKKQAEKQRIEDEKRKIEEQRELEKNGNPIVNIVVSVMLDGSYKVVMNDNDITKDRIGKYLIKNVDSMVIDNLGSSVEE